MSRWRGFVAAALWLLALPLLAGEIAPTSVSIRLQVDKASTEPLTVVLELVGEDEEVHRVEVTAPGRAELTTVGDPPWTLRAEAAGWWSAPQVISPPVEAPVVLRLWPEVRLRASVRVPKGSEVPEGLAVRLRKVGAGGRADELEATVLCPVDAEHRLDCRLPAVAGLDLRLRAPGFASRFFWDRNLSQGGIHDLGTLRLRPGASVVGEVEVPSAYELADVTVRLVPTHGAPTVSADDERVARQVAAEERPDERGFFSLEGLTAGAYRLVVTHPDLAPWELDPLRVVDGSQSEVAETIVLRPPIPLRLVLDPSFDPYGEDWRVQLYRRPPSGQGVRVSGDGDLVAMAGAVDVAVAPGPYEVRVLDSRGVRLATEEVVADASGAPHVLTLEPILVEGRVTLGDEPLLARVTFRGPSTLEMDADVEGRFSGYLPRAGEWDVAVKGIEPPVEWRRRAVEVEVDEGEDRAMLHLRLPDTTLRGTVVDAGGRPVPGAEVTLADPNLTRPEVSVTTDEDGRFLVRGQEEGPVQAQAVLHDSSGELWSSRPEFAQLFEDEEAEVRLVLRPHAWLRGRVVAADGNPVPRATLEAIPFDAAGLLDAPEARPFATDAAGRFEISFPRSIEAIHLLVMAPGHPLTVMEVPLADLGDLPLPPAGGTLVLDLPGRVDEFPWADRDRPRLGLLGPQGVKYLVGLLGQWASLNGHPWQREAGEVTLPQLAPGRYRVCWFAAEEWLVRAAAGRDCMEAEVRAGEGVRVTPQLRATSAPGPPPPVPR